VSGERMEDFIAATRSVTSEGAFVQAFPHPFLVREATGKKKPDAPASEDRRTMRVSKAAAPVGDGFAQGGDVWIFRVCPRDPERNEGAVTLGRDAGCDVVLADGSVSSLHARFTLRLEEPDDDEDDGKRFFVEDAGSSNGTFIDGEAIPPATPSRVEDQASIRFGPQVKVQFFTSAGFFQFMDFYRRIKKRGP
jgi:hypothetical protein